VSEFVHVQIVIQFFFASIIIIPQIPEFGSKMKLLRWKNVTTTD